MPGEHNTIRHDRRSGQIGFGYFGHLSADWYSNSVLRPQWMNAEQRKTEGSSKSQSCRTRGFHDVQDFLEGSFWRVCDHGKLRISVCCATTVERCLLQIPAEVARQEKSLRVCDVRHCLVLRSEDELSRVTLAEFSEDCEDGMSRTELFFLSAEILTAELL